MLAHYFQRTAKVSKAYLVRVGLGESDNYTVALALRTQAGPDQKMVNKVGRIFAGVFNATQHLDILFLSEDQEGPLSTVCKPFFTPGAPSFRAFCERVGTLP